MKQTAKQIVDSLLNEGPDDTTPAFPTSGAKSSRTPWEIAGERADTMFGEFGLATCDEDDMNEIVDLKKLDRLAKAQFGEFGFATLSEDEMEQLLNAHPECLRPEEAPGPFKDRGWAVRTDDAGEIK